MITVFVTVDGHLVFHIDFQITFTFTDSCHTKMNYCTITVFTIDGKGTSLFYVHVKALAVEAQQNHGTVAGIQRRYF